MTSVEIGGLDGSTPLGFLGALGLLCVLEDAQGKTASLAWSPNAPYRAVLSGVQSVEAIADLVHRDLETWDRDPVLGFRYPKVEKEGAKQFGGLAPPLRVLRPWLSRLVDRRQLRPLRYASALMTDALPEIAEPKKVVTDDVLRAAGVPTDPSVPADWIAQQTAFDFTSRNTQFLDQIDQIRRALRPERILDELSGGTPTAEDVRAMGWDAESIVPGALVGRREPRRYPATEWLAFRGMALCPVLPTTTGVRTAGCEGRRKRGHFRWPVWQPLISSRVIAALIGHPRLVEMTPGERRARGVLAVFSTELTKGADGYQGVFSPSSPR